MSESEKPKSPRCRQNQLTVHLPTGTRRVRVDLHLRKPKRRTLPPGRPSPWGLPDNCSRITFMSGWDIRAPPRLRHFEW